MGIVAAKAVFDATAFAVGPEAVQAEAIVAGLLLAFGFVAIVLTEGGLPAEGEHVAVSEAGGVAVITFGGGACLADGCAATCDHYPALGWLGVFDLYTQPVRACGFVCFDDGIVCAGLEVYFAGIGLFAFGGVGGAIVAGLEAAFDRH